MTRVVDWSQPIEAVHEDGRVVAVELLAGVPQPDSEKQYRLSEWLPTIWCYFERDGTHREPSCPWHIRNRPPEAS